MHWWVKFGYPNQFEPGEDYWPRPGQVVKYYRKQKIHNGKAWTQNDLARALDITEHQVRAIENKDEGMDFKRRRILCGMLDIPPILLGVVTFPQILEKLGEETPEPSISTPGTPTHKVYAIDTKEYHSHLILAWNAHHKQTGANTLNTMLMRVDALSRELLHTRDEKTQIQSLLSGYHEFVANLLRDRQEYDLAIEHLNRAFRFADTLDDHELIAQVLYRRGNTLQDAGRIEEAIDDYEQAWMLERVLSDHLRGSLLLETGVTRAKSATSLQAKKAAIAIVDQGGRIARNIVEEDPLHILGRDRYHMGRGAALIAIGWNDDAIHELNLVEAGPNYQRREAYRNILKARAYVNQEKYDDATDHAAEGLRIAQKVHSEWFMARVATIHSQLAQSRYGASPEVANLGRLLRG